MEGLRSAIGRDDDEVCDAKPFIRDSKDLPLTTARDHEPLVLELFQSTFPLRFGARVAGFD
jgi:hypothetical protein